MSPRTRKLVQYVLPTILSQVSFFLFTIIGFFYRNNDTDIILSISGIIFNAININNFFNKNINIFT